MVGQTFLKDSNCAGIGTAEDKALRKKAAQTEPAWAGVGEKPGLWVWRMESFVVVPWDARKYGQFHTADSYIVLQTLLKDRKLDRYIYFWLGSETSTDEMGVAAYKTVELDDYFDGEAKQIREVQFKESRQFRALFPKLSYLEGGVPSGFVASDIAVCFVAKLYCLRKSQGVVEDQEVSRSRSAMNEGDCYVLDAGPMIYVYHGEEAEPQEKFEATAMAARMQARRGGKTAVTRELDDEFWKLLGGEGPIRPAKAWDTGMPPPPSFGDGVLYKLSNKSGKLEMTEVGKEHLNKSMLETHGVMILDHGFEIFTWLGLGANTEERKHAFRCAIDFLKLNGRELQIPIHLFKEGAPTNNQTWDLIFGNGGNSSRRAWRCCGK